ncbi:MAG: hypothetical protein DRJ49_00085 [Thermoprotei archaeon]|nr:MAG: hypothetical protein DRJ49_00085 [Thermoprotei archaeon]
MRLIVRDHVMNSKRLVIKVFEGEGEEVVPLHIESDCKNEEALLGDIVGVGAKVVEWRKFYRKGGPFARRPHEKLSVWINRVNLEEYEWPEVDEVVRYAVEVFEERAKKYSESKFIVYKVLGPTETSESFFTRGLSRIRTSLNQVVHEFGFATFLLLNVKKACKLFNKISRYVLELIKAGAEIEYVDAVRVADDVATYGRLLYPQWFIKEHYLKWHKEFSRVIKKSGKYAILHCDGDILINSLREIFRIYDGIHPLDLRPRFSTKDARRWINSIVRAREIVGSRVVFFTGIPIELLFNDSIGVEDIYDIVRMFLETHGREMLILATTHSNYPGRSYKEPLVMRKLEAINRLRKAR